MLRTQLQIGLLQPVDQAGTRLGGVKNHGGVNSFFLPLFEPLGSSKRILKHYVAGHPAPFDEYPKDAHVL